MIRLSLCKGTKQFNEVGKNVFHAQSLQSCPILCDLMNCSMPGSSVHGISQERILEWVANPSAGDLLNPGLNPCLLHCQADPLLLSSVQTLSCVLLFATPWTAACQASLSIANFQSLLKLMSIESVMPSNHLILCRPLLLLPSVFPSIRVFSIRWPNYWSFSFSFSPSNEYSGLISFRIDWFDLLAVQGTLKSLQHHSSKHQFFGAWLSI